MKYLSWTLEIDIRKHVISFSELEWFLQMPSTTPQKETPAPDIPVDKASRNRKKPSL
jgi:hypothetical protein